MYRYTDAVRWSLTVCAGCTPRRLPCSHASGVEDIKPARFDTLLSILATNALSQNYLRGSYCCEELETKYAMSAASRICKDERLTRPTFCFPRGVASLCSKNGPSSSVCTFRRSTPLMACELPKAGAICATDGRRTSMHLDASDH
jgi:hypothetical protein